MKNLIILTVLFLSTSTYTNANANANANAKFDLQFQNKKLDQILKFEENQQYFLMAAVAANASSEILNQINAEGIVASANTSLLEIRNEVVVETKSNTGGFSFLMGLLSGKIGISWDTAEIITTNASEVNSFPAKIITDYSKLQYGLTDYVRKNESALVYAKAFAIKALNATIRMSKQDRAQLSATVKRAVQFAQQIRFLAIQNVSMCVQTNYTNRSSSSGLSVGGPVISFNLSDEKQQRAHTKTTCQNQSGRTAEMLETEISSYRLNQLDRVVESLTQQLGMIEAIEAKAPEVITWGLSYASEPNSNKPKIEMTFKIMENE